MRLGSGTFWFHKAPAGAPIVPEATRARGQTYSLAIQLGILALLQFLIGGAENRAMRSNVFDTFEQYCESRRNNLVLLEETDTDPD